MRKAAPALPKEMGCNFSFAKAEDGWEEFNSQTVEDCILEPITQQIELVEIFYQPNCDSGKETYEEIKAALIEDFAEVLETPFDFLPKVIISPTVALYGEGNLPSTPFKHGRDSHEWGTPYNVFPNCKDPRAPFWSDTGQANRLVIRLGHLQFKLKCWKKTKSISALEKSVHSFCFHGSQEIHYRSSSYDRSKDSGQSNHPSTGARQVNGLNMDITKMKADIVWVLRQHLKARGVIGASKRDLSSASRAWVVRTGTPRSNGGRSNHALIKIPFLFIILGTIGLGGLNVTRAYRRQKEAYPSHNPFLP